jgi:methyl-accepting chemotaxis protein
VEREQAIAETSDIAYEVSTKTFSDAAKGIEVLDSTNESMAELAQKLSSASDSIQALNDQSAKISSLVESIQGIADQTNLLALNAAIEAARAGEQGRGFAVVADEVRQLASRTSSTTEQIIAVVTQNTQLTEKAVSQVQLSISESEKARELSHDSDKVMNDIQHGAQQVVDAVSQFKSRL